MKLKHLVCVAAVSLGLTQVAQAAVINSADVAGLSTFQDTNTGRIWLDMNNFFNAAATVGTTGYNMIAIAQNAGFTFAMRTDVEGLLNTLPLGGGEWAGYASVMGYGIPRSLIWGMYDDGNGNPYGWAWSYNGNSQWSYADDVTDANGVQNAGSPGAIDMGIWAYKTGNVVPEPGTLALLGLASIGLFASRRKYN